MVQRGFARAQRSRRPVGLPLQMRFVRIENRCSPNLDDLSTIWIHGNLKRFVKLAAWLSAAVRIRVIPVACALVRKLAGDGVRREGRSPDQRTPSPASARPRSVLALGESGWGRWGG